MYWNDRDDYPVAIFQVTAADELEAEQIAHDAGGSNYEDDWPVLTEDEESMSPDRLLRYKNKPWQTYFKEAK